MNPDFVLWMDDPHVPHACMLADLDGFDEMFRLAEGVAQMGGFPADASYSMSPDYPRDTVLTDSLLNTDDLKVISARLKDFFDEHAVGNVEYLRVAIKNHKHKLASRNYYIVNPILAIDCLDRKASRAKISPVNEERIMSIKKLVLKESALPIDRAIFRIANFPDVHLVRRDLAEAMSAAKFTGIRWVEISDYPEI